MCEGIGKSKSSYIHVLAIIITALCCIYIRALDSIFIFNGEFGYWAHVVSAIGYNWKELISTTPYYTWGYSIWLIPIIALLPTPLAWYKAVIFLNVLFLVLSFFLCYQSGRKLFCEADERLVALVSFIVIIYPSNIVYAQAAWTESLSYMLVWLETYLIVCLDEKFSNKYFVSATLVLVCAYAVHNRSIGVVLAGLVALCLVLIKHKKKFWHFLILCMIMMAGYKGIDLVKNHQIQALWSSSQISDMNNVGLNTATITNYSSRLFEQTGYFFISLFGKYIYLLIGTGLTLPIVACKILRDFWGNIKGRDWWQNYCVGKIWILLVTAFMYGICVIGMNRWEFRPDLVVYSRYMENALGPVLFLAIMYVIIYIPETRIGLLISGCSLFIGIGPVYYWITHADGVFNTICSPVIGAFYQAVHCNSMFTAFILLVVVLVVTFSVLLGMTYCKKEALRARVVAACFALTYCVVGYYGGKYALGIRDVVEWKTASLYDAFVEDLDDAEIYYVKNDAVDAMCMNPKYFQFLIPNKTIHVVTSSDLEEFPYENVFIMVEPDDKILLNTLRRM